ncbi:unnamed protein product [Rotaria socialis]|uniref:Uncharacterized protein n=1 Tax=Rotaria socialis TaxID=392032 RepID=A0A817RV27_9BILA|nr:unnamed protein product [Rotaria socialis]CAF3300248.1 unnamed protein product [Rotaria socialis]CAF3456265.1 unnamed protein product [Rotaria socialis]CAF3597345.1 unnamed protein product [Rotaria socialis]CAF3694386.1 unnamed protein product [Rotaria socialis]
MRKDMTMIVIIGLFLTNMFTFGNGYCFVGQTAFNISSYGTVEKYCEYKGMRFAIGSSFKLASPECIECTCKDPMYQCCGYGASGGVFAVEGCKTVTDFCNVLFVDPKDPNKLCGPSATKAIPKTTVTTTTEKRHQKHLQQPMHKGKQ